MLFVMHNASHIQVQFLSPFHKFIAIFERWIMDKS